VTIDDLRAVLLKALDNSYDLLRKAVAEPGWTDSGDAKFRDAREQVFSGVELLRRLNEIDQVAQVTAPDVISPSPAPAPAPAIEPKPVVVPVAVKPTPQAARP
jgi:hypothetical protein